MFNKKQTPIPKNIIFMDLKRINTYLIKNPNVHQFYQQESFQDHALFKKNQGSTGSGMTVFSNCGWLESRGSQKNITKALKRQPYMAIRWWVAPTIMISTKKMIFRFLLPFQNGKIQKTVKLILNSMFDSNLMFRVTVRENHKRMPCSVYHIFRAGQHQHVTSTPRHKSDHVGTSHTPIAIQITM